MSAAIDSAIAAYNKQAAANFTLDRMRGHQADIEDRRLVTSNANDVIGLSGQDELVWNELPVQMVGMTPVYTFTVLGYDFRTYVNRGRWARTETARLEMRCAPWAKTEKMKRIDAIDHDGWRSIYRRSSFGEAVLIAELEARMPDRLRSTSPRIANRSPRNITPVRITSMLESGFPMGVAPGREDLTFRCNSDVEMFEEILRTYQAERAALHCPVHVKRGPLSWCGKR